MQKIHGPPILLGNNKPSIYSLLLSQDQIKSKDEILSGWNFSSNNNNSNHHNNHYNNAPQFNIQPIKSYDSSGGYIHESKKFKFSQDQFNSSDESDNGEYSPKPRYNGSSNNNSSLDSMMKHFGSNHSLPTFRQFQQNLTVPTSSSSSLHSSPSSASSSPSYSVPIVALQGNEAASQDFKSPFEQPHSPSYPQSPSTNNNNNNSDFKNKQIQQWLQELQQIKKRESILLENLKYYNVNSVSSPSSSFSSDESDEDLDYQQPSQQPSSPQQASQIAQQPLSPQQHQALVIQQQPSESIICNRYIHPAIVVVVDQEIINQTSGYLIVNASLVPYPFKGNAAANQNTLNKNQQLLQGVKSILVEKNGFVIFNKLKLNEVSAKYPNQLFCICFTLSDISSDKQIHVLSQVTTTPFHIISKPNKRKCDEIETEDAYGSPKSNSPPSSPSLHNITSSSSTSSSTNSSNKLVDECAAINTNDPNYIDITDLLILPQKEAAARLGISESMLCKRFKECTRRKWPYRYLRKIDKFIKLLSLQNINEIPKEEKEKLERYILEREECLRPVKIRITGCVDKEDQDQFTTNLSFNKSSSPSQQQQLTSSPSTTAISATTSKSQIQNIINEDSSSSSSSSLSTNSSSSSPSTSKLFESRTTGGEGKGLENILETLEMLKHTHRQ